MLSTKIATIQDVEDFFKYLIKNESLNFHPDERFEDYINLETREPTYTEEEAALRNALMDQCFELCEREGVEIYSIGLMFFLQHTGLDKLMEESRRELEEAN